jgi:hypothetical protein
VGNKLEKLQPWNSNFVNVERTYITTICIKHENYVARHYDYDD